MSVLTVKMVCFLLFSPAAGANVGEQCRAGSEAAGVAAQGGWPPAQRNSRVAQHAQLDLQTPSPVLPSQSLLPEEFTQAGTHGCLMVWYSWGAKVEL